MTSPRFLVVNGNHDLWGVPSTGRIISLGYQGLDFPIFRVVLETFRPVALIDLRESASFRDRGFTVERAFHIFATRQVEYERVDHELGALQPLSQTLVASLRSWLARGPVVLLGSTRSYQGSERERVVRWLSRDRPLEVLLHERDSHHRWRALELFEPSPARCESEERAVANPLQLQLPLPPGFEPRVKTPRVRRRRTHEPPSGT